MSLLPEADYCPIEKVTEMSPLPKNALILFILSKSDTPHEFTAWG